jgi:hypothetical protein
MSSVRLVTEIDADNPTLHDLQLTSDGQFVYVGFDADTDDDDNADIVRQRVKTRLLLFKEEWYQDQRVGMPWIQQLLTKGITEARINAIFRDAIQNTPGVAFVESVTSSISNRLATVSFTATTDTGIAITVEDLDLPFISSPQEANRG